ncbi:MAG: PQQ-binding-like beta-propeller repeat protein [Actinomycetota bacterium]
MTDEQDHETGGVLRPFEPSPQEPLPPVQASSVVVPGLDADRDTAGADDVPVDAIDAESSVETAAPPSELVDVGAEPSAPEVWAASSEADMSVLTDLVGDDGESLAIPSPSRRPAEGAIPAATENPQEIVLPRQPFLIGAGIAALLLVLLFVLWRTAGDGDSAPVAAPLTSTTEPAVQDDAAVEPAPSGVPDEVVAEMTEAAESRIADLESQLGEQAAAVADLEAELAAVPPTALRGAELRRVVVAADATALSVGEEGIAVIGPFGGYASIDPATTTVTASSQIGTAATRVLRTASAVWVTNYTDSELIRVDFTTNEVLARFAFPSPDGLDKLGGTLVIASHDGGFVAQVDAGPGTISRQVDVGGQPSDVIVTPDEAAIWVALFDTGEVIRIDAASFEITSRLAVGAGPVGLTLVDNTLWVANHEEGTVVAVDTASEAVVSRFSVGAGPSESVIFQGSLWVTATDAGELVQLDPSSGEVITRTPLGSSNLGGPTGLAIGSDSLWVAMQGERSVVRVTPANR